MRYFRIRLFWLVTLLFTPAAHADLLVKFDCYFDAGTVSCQTLHDAYFAAIPWIKERTTDEVDLKIKLRSFVIDRATRYRFDFVGTGDRPDFSLLDDVPTSFTLDGATLQVLGDLQKCSAPFGHLAAPAQTQDGSTMIVVTDPSGNLPVGTGTSSSPWYVSASGSGSVAIGDIKDTSGATSLLVNRSTESWRMVVSGSARYEKVQVSNGGASEEAVMASFGTKVLVARSFGRNWSVAAIAGLSHNPGVNINREIGAGAGVEWDLVPFLKTNDHSFGVQYSVAHFNDDYSAPNVLDEQRAAYFQQFLQAYLSWHFDRVDLKLAVNGSTVLGTRQFDTVGATEAVTWRITPNISLSSASSVAYRNGLINQPLKDNGSDLSKFVSGSNYSKLSVQTTLVISYTFGNSGLNSQDIRWKN